MLTQDQKNQLNPLTLHPKFGRLLTEAIKTWETMTPKQRTFCDDTMNNCCLVGASVLNDYILSSNWKSAVTLASEKFTGYEVVTVSDGFDNEPSYEDEGYNFGKAVSDIVLGK